MLKQLSFAVAKLRRKLTYCKETTTYSYHNGKWYLKTANRRYEGRINSQSRGIENQLWTANTSITVTDIGTKNIPAFTEGDVYASEASVSGLISNNADPAFWGNYNIVEPTADSVFMKMPEVKPVEKQANVSAIKLSNRENGFTRADTLRGKLTPLRSYDVLFYHLDVAVDIPK